MRLPGAETPTRMGVLTEPVPLGMPLQFAEAVLSHVHSPGWSNPDAEKNEPGHAICVLGPSSMQDTSTVQPKKLQWVSSEQPPDPVSPALTQEAPRSLPQEDRDSLSRKEGITACPDSPQAGGTGQDPLGGRPSSVMQHPFT